MSLPLRVIVCDDESMARKRVVRLLEESAQAELVVECDSADAVLERLAREEFDVAILDINMPGKTGIELVEAMAEDRPYVIFLTAHPEHALKAFDVGAIDYLLKPVDTARLDKALDRAKKHLDREERPAAAAGDPAARPALQKLAVPTKGGVVLLNPHDVTHAVFDGALVTVFTKDQKLLTDFTLQELEAKLPQGVFERVHRRALLNLDHTERLEPVASGGYTAKVTGGHGVDVSRQAARKLRRWLGLT
ncbi:MAG: response regulator transcription factor [Myxococcales bacterium]|nr:response regulator transcription factor [Myxococcales bacterium]